MLNHPANTHTTPSRAGYQVRRTIGSLGVILGFGVIASAGGPSDANDLGLALRLILLGLALVLAFGRVFYVSDRALRGFNPRQRQTWH
jgi:hypothetical protein